MISIVPSLTTVNFQPGRDGHTVKAVCLHVTDGETAAGAINWFKNPLSQVSAHYVYDPVARVAYRVVEEKDTAWANGRLSKPNLARAVVARWVNDGINPNSETVSIEKAGLASAGWAAHEVEDVRELAHDICRRNGLTPGIETIIGHRDIDSVTRSRCPSLTGAQWARMLTTGAAPALEDAALEAEYQRNRDRLGAKRFKGKLDRPYYRGSVLVCAGGVVATTPRLTAIVEVGLIDDTVTFWEANNVIIKL